MNFFQMLTHRFFGWNYVLMVNDSSRRVRRVIEINGKPYAQLPKFRAGLALLNPNGSTSRAPCRWEPAAGEVGSQACDTPAVGETEGAHQ